LLNATIKSCNKSFLLTLELEIFISYQQTEHFTSTSLIKGTNVSNTMQLRLQCPLCVTAKL